MYKYSCNKNRKQLIIYILEWNYKKICINKTSVYRLFNFMRYMRVYPDNRWKFLNNALALMCLTSPELQARRCRIGSERDVMCESSCLAHNSSEKYSTLDLALEESANTYNGIILDSNRNCLTLTTV